MSRARWVLVTAALVVAASGIEAQMPPNPVPLPPIPEDPDCYYYDRCPAVWWGEELAVVGANVLIGALTAGIWQELGGGSFKDGFTRGALGGAVIYGGKRIASGRFPVAGLMGRQVAAVGHSMVRNAGEGRATFERLALPILFLPARLQLGSRGKDAPVRADLYELWNLIYGLAEPKLQFDWGRSLSFGAAVFISPGYDFVTGGNRVPAMAGVGTIYVNRDLVAFPGFHRTAAHERVHVLQSDATLIWAEAGDDWLEARIEPLGWLSRYVAPDLTAFGLFLVGGWIQSEVDYNHLPWELEARSLAGQDP